MRFPRVNVLQALAASTSANMGNCCEERRNQTGTSHSYPKPRRPDSNSSNHRGSTEIPADSKKRPRPKRYTLTSDQLPDTSRLDDVVRRLASTAELNPQRHTHIWVGTIGRESAAAAMELASMLESSAFARDAITRVAFFTAIKSRALPHILSGIQSEERSVRRAFAYLLETLLRVFEGLTSELVAEMLKLHLFTVLAEAMDEMETTEFRLAIATSLRHMYVNNIVVQKKLLQHRTLVAKVVRFLGELKDPVQVTAVVGYLNEFVLRPDGSVIIEQWDLLTSSGLIESARKAQENLQSWTGKNRTEIDKAQEALRSVEMIDAE